MDLRHYIIGCVALSEDDLQRTGQAFVTVAGSSLNVTSKMVLNYNVTVLHVKGIGNSAILVVDRLLDVPDDEHPENVSFFLYSLQSFFGFRPMKTALTVLRHRYLIYTRWRICISKREAKNLCGIPS